MSIVLGGSSANLDILISSIINYKSLCDIQENGSGSATKLPSWFEEGFAADFKIETKYYDANLHFAPVEIKIEQGIGEIYLELLNKNLASAEGFILIIPLDEDFNKEYEDALSKLVAEHQRLSFRLLVSMKHVGADDLSDEKRMTRVMWALDSGFEHIEIDDSNLLEGWKSREKEGLPRLIEALHSNMWSTMKRKDKDCVTPLSVSAPVPATGSLSSGPPVCFGTTNSEDPIRLIEVKMPVSEPNHVLPQQFKDEITGDSDEKLFDQFADVMSQAREYRDQAVAGGLSDNDRRNRAEAVAIAMSNMLGFDEDDSDGD